MSKGNLTKVMKYTLRYVDGCGDFHQMQAALWNLQKQSREVLNRSIQIAFDWDYRNREAFKKTGEYLDVRSETGYKRLDGYIYDCLKGDYPDFASGNLNATIQTAWKKYGSSKKDVLIGKISLPSYRSDQPILFHKSSVRLSVDKYGYPAVELTAFSNAFKKEHQFFSNLRFEILIQDGTQRSIFSRIIDGGYGLGQCQISYEKKKWFLLLTYTFPAEKRQLDSEKTLGVDLGETLAICASSVSEYGRFVIEGGEVTQFAAQLEVRQRSMQRQAAYCGEGRIGHGTKTRVADVYKAKDRIASFRDTINHRYSKALIDYAVKHQFGTIQMEDLSGIKNQDGFPKFLRHWTYYDLQSKIEAKAKEQGIIVVRVNPRFTSQRCSKCGYVDAGNRKNQEHFLCLKCGFKCNADFNASQNLSIRDIDKIIEKEVRT